MTWRVRPDASRPRGSVTEPHRYVPCNYAEGTEAVRQALCSNPGGWDACHRNGCGLAREHAVHQEADGRVIPAGTPEIVDDEAVWAPRLEAMISRVAKASPGPWAPMMTHGTSNDLHLCRLYGAPEQRSQGVFVRPVLGCTWHPEVPVSYTGLSRQQCIENAIFATEARQDVPALIARVQAQAREIVQLRAELAALKARPI